MTDNAEAKIAEPDARVVVEAAEADRVPAVVAPLVHRVESAADIGVDGVAAVVHGVSVSELVGGFLVILADVLRKLVVIARKSALRL